MRDTRPGCNPLRLVRLMHQALGRLELNLHDAVVLTEAATGAYAVTPVLAAMAQARRVYALARASCHGRIQEIMDDTMELAARAGVTDGITVITATSPAVLRQADIVTNSGHLRPLDAQTIGHLKPTAVIPAMYESWELRPQDIDLGACRQRGILVAGTDEQHPAVGALEFLGPLAAKLLMDAGIAPLESHILLLCDNALGPFIERGLAGLGARLERCDRLDQARGADCDAILVALQSRTESALAAGDVSQVARRWPGTVVCQLWGDLDRAALQAQCVRFWPSDAPAAGHMGIAMSAPGPEAVVRLQSGGLKVGELLWRYGREPRGRFRRLVQLL